MRRHSLIVSVLLLSVFMFGNDRLLRADITGKIIGTVADPSGATVPGAKVTLRNPSTGLTRTLQTDASGSYEFLLVPIGEGYSVEVEAAGFEKGVEQGITLLVNQVFRADFSLRIGSATQKVEVSAAPAQVETTSTQVGDVIESSKMETLPLNGRSYIDLLGLQAGVAPVASGDNWTGTVSGLSSSGTVSVDGQRETQNGFLVNGGDVEHTLENGASLVPTLDSIAEFRLLTNSFDAEYGRFSGAIVNVVTKSGTNSFHGDLFEFLRNNAFDSRNFYDLNQTSIVTGQPIPGSALAELKRNQFGGTIGGPILKNRLFFFGDYQGTRQVNGDSTGNVLVPSALERTGDFSDIGTTGFSDLTGTVQGDDLPGHFAQTLSSRLGYTVNPGEPYYTSGCNTLADGQAGMCVFPGRVIPQKAWSPAAAGTLQFIPNSTLTVGGVPYFSSSAYKATIRDDKLGIRIDSGATRWGSWNAYYHFDDTNLINPYGGGGAGGNSNVPGFAVGSPQRVQQINLGNTWSPNPSTVNEARINFVRTAQTTGLMQPGDKGLGSIGQYGFSTGPLGLYFQGGATPEGIPQIGLTVMGINFGTKNPDITNDNNFHISDNLSKIQGRHTMKFGADFRHLNDAFRFSPVNGDFTFNGAETGNDYADYLIGAVLPGNFFEASSEIEDPRTKYVGLYAQDSYKFKSNLTLNYGLRWQVSTPWADKFGRVTTFVPGEQSKVFPDSPTGWVFPGDPGVPAGESPTRYDDFDPRIGIAYSPGFSSGFAAKIFGGPGKSSIRAAFGVFHTIYEEGTMQWSTGDDPWSIWDTQPVGVYFEEPFQTRTSGPNPRDPFPFVLPQKYTDFSFLNFMPEGNITAIKTDNVLPYAEHYNLTFQRALGSTMTMTLAYVGTEGHHLIGEIEANPGIPSRCLQIAALAVASGNAGEACGPYGEDVIYNIGSQTFYGTRVYSVTSGRYLADGLVDGTYTPWAATFANSDYNALQATLEKRAGPVRFLAAYTYGRSMDDSSSYLNDGVNPYNIALSRSRSAFDMTHNFVVSYVYNLPFHKLIKSSAGPAAKLLGGWELTGITRFTTGFPVTIYESGDHGLIGSYGSAYIDQPDYNGQPITFMNPRTNTSQQYFSISQFSAMPLGGTGTANRRFFASPGFNNWDLGLHKSTRITETKSVDFRAEFFNIFNHTQFTGVQSDFNNPAVFGDVTSARAPRIGQMALTFNF